MKKFTKPEIIVSEVRNANCGACGRSYGGGCGELVRRD